MVFAIGSLDCPMSAMIRLLLFVIVLVIAAPAGAGDRLDHTGNTAHGPMCGLACRAGHGLGHSVSSPVQYGSQAAASFGTKASDGMNPDRCRMPCRYTSSCCFHRVRTAGESAPPCPHCRPKPPT